jgi:hypothetical protein
MSVWQNRFLAGGSAAEVCMATSERVKGPASYFPSIEKTYGHPVEHWFGLLREAGAQKHMELVAMLKSSHGLGHGHANALVAHFLAKR